MQTKALVWNFTLLNVYEICPYQCWRRFIRKDIPFQTTPEMQRGRDVHAALEYRIQGGKQLPVDMQQWEPYAAALDGLNAKTEIKMGITAQARPTAFFGDDVWMRGTADVVVVQNTSAFLLDHKTGKPREDVFELKCQAMLLHAAMPQLTMIKGAYGWLRQNSPGVMHDLSDTNRTWEKVNGIVADITENMHAGEFEKKPSPLCGWCDCLDCEFNKKKGLA